MLAIGRALTTNAKLLMLDEATEGLPPLIRAEIWNCSAKLRAAGLTILIIDKNIDVVLSLSDSIAVIQSGELYWTGSSDMFPADRRQLESVVGL